jgi:hypothetical protein
VGGVPVVGELSPLDGGAAGGVRGVAALLDASLQGAGIGGMQGAALHRQQVVVDRLLHQRVPEDVAAAGLVDGQHVVGDRLAQPPHELLGEERVALRTGQELPHQRRRGPLAEDPGQQFA